MNKITGKELGGLLFSIHHHIGEHCDESGNQAKIVYHEEDILKLLEALGLPKVEWGECIDVEQFKKNIEVNNEAFYTYLRHKLAVDFSGRSQQPVDSVMSYEVICSHDEGWLCQHRLDWLINEIKTYFEKK